MRLLMFVSGLFVISTARAAVIEDSPLPIGVNAEDFTSVRSPMVYDNSAGQLFTLPHFSFTHDCDDGSFAPQSSSAYLIDSINLGFFIRQSTPLDIVFQFYDQMIAGTNPVNNGLIPGSLNTIHVGELSAGMYQTGFVDVTPFELPVGMGGSASFFDNWGIEVFIRPPNSNGFTNQASTLFAGGPQTIGSSADVYWHRGDSTTCADPRDERNFGGGSQQANLFLQLKGTPVPEPAGILPALLILAAFRRKPERRNESWDIRDSGAVEKVAFNSIYATRL